MKHPSFEYKYRLENKVYHPFLPIRLSCGKKVHSSEGLLDSGADCLTISKRLSDYLELKLGKGYLGGSAAGEKSLKYYPSKVNVLIGRGKNIHNLGEIDIEVSEGDIPILIGKKPIFQMYQITFREFNTPTFIMIPKDEIQKIEQHKKSKRR